MIHREDRGPITLLRIEHGKANAIDVELFEALHEHLDDLETADCRALVLTGTGKSFSAGVDLFRLLDGGDAYVRAFLPTLSRGVKRLFGFHKPVVAALNGHAIAGGCILALACDYRLMSRGKGKMGVTELSVGVPFPVAALEILRFQVPDRLAQELIYTARLLGPEAALDEGLVDRLCDEEELLEKAIDQAERFARVPGNAFGLTKHQLRQETIERIPDQELHLDDEILRIWTDPTTLEGIRSFMAAATGKK